MTDREQAYEQNVTGLEKAWAERLESFAHTAIDRAMREEPDDVQLYATELVAARLFDSERWEAVEATDISDIAYEAVSRVIDSRVTEDND